MVTTDAPMTAERLALIIGGSISGILDAVFQYAAGQVAAAVTPGEARSEPAATPNPWSLLADVRECAQDTGTFPGLAERILEIFDAARCPDCRMPLDMHHDPMCSQPCGRCTGAPVPHRLLLADTRRGRIYEEVTGEPAAEACARCACPSLDGSLYCGHCAMGERPPQACDTGSAAGDKPYACYAQDSCAFDKRCPNYRGCRRVEPEEAAELERLRAFRDRAAWSAGHYRDIAQEHGDDLLRSVADTLDGWLAKAGTADGTVVIDDRADQLQRLAAEILAQFTEEGHPGRWVTRTHWVANDRLRFWRDVLDGHARYQHLASTGDPT